MTTLTTHRPHQFDPGGGAAAEPIDTAIRLVTPERVTFTYPLAGPFRRSLAYMIDLIMVTILIFMGFLVARLLTLGTPAGLGLWLAITFFIYWGYGIICEGGFNGQTIGKRLVGIRVVAIQGVPITGTQAAIRNLIGTVDGPIPFFYLPGLLAMLCTQRFQRLGDLAAGTMVVIEEVKPDAGILRITDKAVLDLIPLLPTRVAATSDQARALSDYVKHRGRFGLELREEIARPLAGPLRQRHDLPATASGDAVLCAYYHRLFLGE